MVLEGHKVKIPWKSRVKVPATNDEDLVREAAEALAIDIAYAFTPDRIFETLKHYDLEKDSKEWSDWYIDLLQNGMQAKD